MTITDHIGRPLTHSSVTKLSVAGAICYALWGCLHLQAAYVVYHVGAALEPGMVQRRVFQDAWNLLFFGVTAIAVALTLNIRNNVWGDCNARQNSCTPGGSNGKISMALRSWIHGPTKNTYRIRALPQPHYAHQRHALRCERVLCVV